MVGDREANLCVAIAPTSLVAVLRGERDFAGLWGIIVGCTGKAFVDFLFFWSNNIGFVV
jgi:hypothetical protein